MFYQCTQTILSPYYCDAHQTWQRVNASGNLVKTQQLATYCSQSRKPPTVSHCELLSPQYTSANLEIGRSSWPVDVFTVTWRTSPCLSGSTPLMRPSNQRFLGWLSSTRSTMSPTSKLLWRPVHFWRCRMVGKYSRRHLRQNWSAAYCIWAHRRRP